MPTDWSFRVKTQVVVLCLAASAAISACGGVHRSEFVGPEASRKAVRTAAVLPLENLTSLQDGGRIVADQISAELTGLNLKMTERGQAEAAMKKLDVVPGGTIDRLAAQRLGEILGVDAVLFGSIAEAQNGEAKLGPDHATIGITVRMVVVKTGETLLAGSYTGTAGTETEAAHKAAGVIGQAVSQ